MQLLIQKRLLNTKTKGTGTNNNDNTKEENTNGNEKDGDNGNTTNTSNTDNKVSTSNGTGNGDTNNYDNGEERKRSNSNASSRANSLNTSNNTQDTSHRDSIGSNIYLNFKETEVVRILPKNTIDINEELVSIQKKYFKKTNTTNSIIQHVGDAKEIIGKIDETFDMVGPFLLVENRHAYRGFGQSWRIHRFSWSNFFSDLFGKTDSTAKRDHQSAVWTLFNAAPL